MYSPRAPHIPFPNLSISKRKHISTRVGCLSTGWQASTPGTARLHRRVLGSWHAAPPAADDARTPAAPPWTRAACAPRWFRPPAAAEAHHSYSCAAASAGATPAPAPAHRRRGHTSRQRQSTAAPTRVPTPGRPAGAAPRTGSLRRSERYSWRGVRAAASGALILSGPAPAYGVLSRSSGGELRIATCCLSLPNSDYHLPYRP
mmetsp:Transcript_20700/g.54099  ORF Transcript_20700/g.54099 Transcript_20700/m.54099 type:complete len:203 (-) Transcript_20700:153-761(-)